jgi:penicillin amidase
VLGPAALPADRRLLTLDLGAGAENEWRSSPLEVRQALQRYADGVNAYIAASTGWRRPLEFQVLRAEPAPWVPVDSLAVGRLFAWRLAENHRSELVRHALAARFGAGEAFRLGGRYPPGAPTVIQGATAASSAGDAAAPPLARRGSRRALDLEAQPPGSTETIGLPIEWPRGLEWLGSGGGLSNNWVLAGRRTASGRPLLANDPHLQLEFPGAWYEIHLVAAGLDVMGVSVPGSPFVILGHNARIAWGMTNTGADVQDLYVERLDVGRRRYFYAGEWLPVQVTEVSIPVRGQSPEPFEVWRTRHGVVFADDGLEWETAPTWLHPQADRSGERRAFALRWDIGGETASAFEALNRAGSWNDFIAAVERFSAPSQNFVYADIEGNIGYAMSGVLPVRRSGVGMLPSDGGIGEDEWVGHVDPASLPRLFNPSSGYVTSSNNQIDRRWSGLVTRDWAAPYRTARLHQLIEQATQVDLDRAAGWQTDLVGLGPAEVLGGLGPALDAARRRGGEAGAVETMSALQAWDRVVDGRPIVTLFHLFEDSLWRHTFFDEMGDPLFSRFYEWAGAERPAGLYVLLDEPAARWWDDIATLERRETRDDIFILAAAEAGRRFREEFGQAPWSDLHAARFEHPLSAGAAALGWLFNRGPSPVPGSHTTVMRVSYHRLRPFAAYEIASWRQIFDVGAWDDARVILPGGQSGHPLSPHYFDQNEMWRLGHYRRQPFSRRAVDAARVHRLLLVPR